MTIPVGFDMTEYLKQAMELEVSVYMQEKATKEAAQALRRMAPVKEEIPEPTLQLPVEPVNDLPPVEPPKPVENKTIWIVGGILAVVGFIIT